MVIKLRLQANNIKHALSHTKNQDQPDHPPII